jgi:hypothetical protein
MDCEACTLATTETCGLFHATCKGCMARMLARSPDFRESVTHGDPTPAYRTAARAFGLRHQDVIAAAKADALMREAAWLR